MASSFHTGQQPSGDKSSCLKASGSSISYNSKRLVCVEHPAAVKNLDRALLTVGGSKEISKTYSQETRRLELRYRPDDVYCKPAYGDRCHTTNLLMKVKRRRKRMPQHSDAEQDSYEYCVEMLGIINTTYKFQAMVDFQYLPMTRNEDGSYKGLLDKLMLKSFMTKSEFLKRDAPLFITPLIFSRLDLPGEYDFRPDRGFTLKKTEQELYLPDNQICIARHRRSIYTMFVSYDEPTPLKPKPGSEEFLMARFNKNTDFLNTIRTLFEERPVWSKNALRCHINPKLIIRLKYVLPLVAYYMTTGPWRAMWVRLGYDARTKPSAKKYQLLDFRIRHRGVSDPLQIQGKGSVLTRAAPMTVTRYRPTVAQIPSMGQKKDLPPREYKKSIYMFEPDVIPPYRQMFYQLCDIREENIQRLVSENDGQETVCTERDGWCLKDTNHKCRRILSECIERIVQKRLFPYANVSTSSDYTENPSTDQSLEDTESKSDDELELEISPEETLNDMETEMLDCV